MSEWISVKDRLPTDADKSSQTEEDYGSYLCRLQLGKYAYYKVLWYADCLLQVSVDFDEIEHGGFFDYSSETGFYEANYVTHWMPIEPPKEDAVLTAIQGVWVWDEQYKEWLCDNCKYPLPNQFGFDDKKWRPKVNFCPNCGARMRGDDNGDI